MSAASFLGIGIGVAALIVILSAMNGLEAESRTRLLSMSEHITLRADAEDSDLQRAREAIAGVDEIASVKPFVRLEAMLSSGVDLRPAIVRGIDPAFELDDPELVSIVGADRLAALEAGSNRIILGRFVAAGLRVQPGDRITLWRAEIEAGRPRPSRSGFTVAGVFDAGSRRMIRISRWCTWRTPAD
ncbi:MAG TPA: ABC transporter permease [Gammaproteobacteria bacterium]